MRPVVLIVCSVLILGSVLLLVWRRWGPQLAGEQTKEPTANSSQADSSGGEAAADREGQAPSPESESEAEAEAEDDASGGEPDSGSGDVKVDTAGAAKKDRRESREERGKRDSPRELERPEEDYIGLDPPPIEEGGSGDGELEIIHSPTPSGDSGTEVLISVTLAGNRKGATVEMHHGPAGGPYKKTKLRAKSRGRYEAWLAFDEVPRGDEYFYWIEASHPRASGLARSGTRASPHVVQIK